MPYMENIDQFFVAKIDEQVEIRDNEVKALRAALKEHHEALKKIHKIKKCMWASGKYHHILNQFQDELNEIFDTAESCLGRGRKR